MSDNRKKILTFKNIDLVDVTPGSEVLFTPFSGKTFIPTLVVVKTRKVGGTVTTQPQFRLSDGTNDIVAASTNANANQGRSKQATVIVDRPVLYSAPLTIHKTVAAAGTNPVFKVDILVEGFFI